MAFIYSLNTNTLKQQRRSEVYTKIFTMVLFIGISCTGIHAQKKKTVAHNNLKKVVVLEQTFNESAEKPVKDSETTFDEKGNIIEEIEYNNEKIKHHTKYEFSETGEKTKETELNPAGKITKTTEFKYDSDGRKTKETEYDNSGKITKTIEYKYNGDLKTERIVYDSNHKAKSKKTYQYTTY
jgi:hypothetical protein